MCQGSWQVRSPSEQIRGCGHLLSPCPSKDWVAVREKGKFVRHKARKSFTAFVRQIWGWGYHVGYPYAKTGIRGLYLYWINSHNHRISSDLEFGIFSFSGLHILYRFSCGTPPVWLHSILCVDGTIFSFGLSFSFKLFFHLALHAG